MSTDSNKPLRADAKRNHERVLAAAREAFTSEGAQIPLDEIARRAGVGAGTVYRHFPTKESLFEAIMLDQLRARTRLLLDLQRRSDPAEALAEFFVQMLENGANRALQDGLMKAGIRLTSKESMQASTDFYEALDGLLQRGQRAGSIRRDLTAKQVKSMLIGVFAASEFLDGDVAEQRHLAATVCDGFRVPADRSS